MDGFWKAAAGILLTVILALSLGKQDISMLLTMAASCMVAVVAISYLEPVMDLIRELESLGEMPGEILDVLLKAVGAALVSEVVSKICSDAGNSSLGKSMQLLGSAVILYLSIPMIKMLLNLIRDILGEL